jgi:hypothetical protein
VEWGARKKNFRSPKEGRARSMWTYLETIGKGRRDVFDRDGGRLGVGSEGEASFDVWRGFAREDEGEGGRGC